MRFSSVKSGFGYGVGCDGFWDQQSLEGSCRETWHNAEKYIEARPVWVGGADGSCQPCGGSLPSVTSCLENYNVTFSNNSAQETGTRDTFSGQVWNGSQCVNASTLSPTGLYTDRCYFKKYGAFTVVCNPGSSNRCDRMVWQRDDDFYGNDAPRPWISSQFYDSNTSIVKYRTAHSKDYYAIVKLGIAPSEKGTVSTISHNMYYNSGY